MGSEIFTGSYPEQIIGAYAVLNLVLLFLLDHWLCNSSYGYRTGVARRVIVCFLYITAAFIPVLALFIRNGVYKYLIEKYSYVWMGFLMYFGALILILTLFEIIVRLIGGAFRDRRKPEEEPQNEAPENSGEVQYQDIEGARESRNGEDFDEEKPGLAGRIISGILLIAVIGASVGINVYGTRHARETVVTHYDIKIDKKVKNTESLRVAFISDLHLSYNSDIAMIQSMVDRLNAEKPDVVLVGGDMFSSSYGAVLEPKEYMRVLKSIKAKEGVYWVYGNHDVEEPLFCGFAMTPPEEAIRTRKMKRFIKKSGFKVLEDKHAAICKGEVQLAGRADKYKPVDTAEKRKASGEILSDLDKEKPILVLEHEPDEFKALAESGADVTFAGHTHAGQIFPGNYVIRLFHDVAYGMRDKYGMKVIVSSGVGCYGPPIRVLTDSEIVIADIHFTK
ncbi:MAG: metallophosphoesterase [Eubacterium sp.]|nr:metallophosphoesterase [Eubacterium sp.]